MSSAASPVGRKASDAATDGSSTTSPMLQAVEPTLPDADNADEEEEEVLVLTPAKSSTTGASSKNAPAPVATPSQDEVDWPAEVESNAHYASHLWFSVDRVLAQAGSGRAASKDFVQFVREKSDLDREYAEKLRKLASKWGNHLKLPVRPRTTDTFQAACCALRNLCTNVAANSDTLANKLDEEVADVFLYEAQDLSERVKVISSDTKESLTELQEAMQNLESTKRSLMKSCEQMADLEENEDDDDHTPAASPQVQRKESAVDFLTDAFVAPFMKSNAESLSKKIAKADSKYVQAIKNVREIRQEYDVNIQKKLQSLERVEVERMRKMHLSLQKFSLIHLQCFQSHVKNIGAVYQTLSEKIQIKNDVEWFVRDCLAANPITMNLIASSKSQGESVLTPLPDRVNPPPLPSKRLFKGHPDFEATRSQQRGSNAPTRKSSSRFEVTDEPTDSENENDVEELTLSSGPDDDDAGDDSEEELLQSVNSTPVRNTAKPVAATSLVSPAAAASASSSSTTPQSKVTIPTTQTEIPLSADQLALIQSLVDRVLQLPFFSTSTPASPITLEPERSQVQQLLQKGFGKVAFVTALKKALPPLIPATAATTENKKDSALESSAADSAASAAAAVDPFAVPLQPELSISRDAFEQLSFLCVELLNSSQEDMHVQPVNSLMTTARSIVCSEVAQTLMEQASDAAAASASVAKQKQTPKSGKKNKKGNKQADEEETVTDASLTATPASSSATPTTLFSRLSSHVLFASPRYYEVSFLAALDRAVSKRANVQPWHTSTEQKQREVQQRILASNMIKNAASDMADIAAMSDAQIVAFVDKMAHVQQLDNSAMENLAQSIPAFERMGLSHMPSANASAAEKYSVATSSPP